MSKAETSGAARRTCKNDDDVELGGVLDDLHGRVVGQDVLKLDVGVVAPLSLAV